ncbi:DEAD/DEAH box helicase [Synechococcus sp. PCC 6312]|uniref:DEAD/DEAH box helicase n=1 Tax=Synechococcus sp. (strain ATCC 27167 / PCC 6312) TaxID=195253 RepID=UPI00029F06CA|nr:DEAD/DEAH box helicase [Synechococcus sp. PCC 6312]AFY62534.1 DNA/RNA helicase, superfamily II, SNF2 family [Synechococcus sp. PCC 6312]
MTILHGSWVIGAQGEKFYLWGERWRAGAETMTAISENVAPYPYALEFAELRTALESIGPGLGDAITAKPCNLALPTFMMDRQLIPSPPQSLPVKANPQAKIAPQPDVLIPWQLTGGEIDLGVLLAWFQHLPLTATTPGPLKIGDDLRFWSHITRWGFDLLGRGKFVPFHQAGADSELVEILWMPLLDSVTDRQRLEFFATQMPQALRFYFFLNPDQAPNIPIPPIPQVLITRYLQRFINYWVGQMPKLVPEISRTWENKKQGNAPQQWFQALLTPYSRLAKTPESSQWLDTLEQWLAPIAPTVTGQPRWQVYFELVPPPTEADSWSLTFGLQAAEQPAWRISAAQIWQQPADAITHNHQTIHRPQETLLTGLGLAVRVFPDLETSLKTARPLGQALNAAQVYTFLKIGAVRLEESGFGLVMPPGLERNRKTSVPRLGLKITAAIPKENHQGLGLASLLDFRWDISLGNRAMTQAEFDRLVALNSPVVEVDGEWVELRPQDIQAAQAFFATRKATTGLTLQDVLRIATGESVTLEKLPVVGLDADENLKALLDALTGKQTLEPINNPPGFEGELRPYQARGVSWLAFLERWRLGACLADDMGLGKTIMLLAFLLYLQSKKLPYSPTLLVCPTSVLGNWEREIKKFAPGLAAYVHHGSDRPKAKALQKTVKKHDIILTSYALIYRDLESLKPIKWQNIVLDEAQNIKNSETRQSKAVRELNAQFRIALTGTPLENRLTELWSILDFLHPGYLGNKPYFQKRYAIPIERYGDTTSLNALRTYVQPFILRRLKTDQSIIQDLPDKQEMTVFCSLSLEQASLYEGVVKKSLQDIENSSGIERRGHILATLTKLKQICNHPAQYLKEKTLAASRSGKLIRLVEMLQELIDAGDRALLFTQYAEMGKLLQAYLQTQTGRKVFFLSGSTPKPKREAMVDQFQQDPQAPPIFILSLKAGGVGLNLTRANHVFHFDRWWNPAVENQATDRAFRIGQTRNVQVHKFVCAGTLEEKIHAQIERKKALAEQVVGAGEQWLTELDTEHLRDLLLLDRNAIMDSESL